MLFLIMHSQPPTNGSTNGKALLFTLSPLLHPPYPGPS